MKSLAHESALFILMFETRASKYKTLAPLRIPYIGLIIKNINDELILVCSPLFRRNSLFSNNVFDNI